MKRGRADGHLSREEYDQQSDDNNEAPVSLESTVSALFCLFLQ